MKKEPHYTGKKGKLSEASTLKNARFGVVLLSLFVIICYKIIKAIIFYVGVLLVYWKLNAMMIVEIPKFLENPLWYDINPDKDGSLTRGYVLTELAPEEARKSYEEYYKEMDD